jgi:hypothetical protein
MLQFRRKLAAVLLIWKNNITNFNVNVQKNSDPRNTDNCILGTDDNDSDQSLKQNYEIVIGVNGLTCPDTLFEGICN